MTFQTIILLLIPIAMIIIGPLEIKAASKPVPRENSIFGFRTKLSLANQENWEFANKFAGSKLIIYGIFLLILVLVGILLGDLQTVNDARLIRLVIMEFAVYLIITLRTQLELKDFDKYQQNKGK